MKKYAILFLFGAVFATQHAYAVISTTIEFTGALDLGDNEYGVEFNNFGGIAISPIGDFNERSPQPGTTGQVTNISLKNSGSQPVEGFLRFNAAPYARFDLEELLPGLYDSSSCFNVVASVAQVCTPAGSGMSLTNLQGGSILSFAVTGQMLDLQDSSTTPYCGYFIAAHPGSYQSYLNDNGGTGWTYTGVFQPSPAGAVCTIQNMPRPTSKDHCKNGRWKAFRFKNQGQCIKSMPRHQHKERDE